MTTLVLGLTPRLAVDVAKAADALGGISHEEVGVRALQLLMRSMYGKQKGRPIGYRPSKFTEAGRQRQARRLTEKRRAKRMRARC